MTPPHEANPPGKGNDIPSSDRRDHDLVDAAALLVDRGYRLGPKLGKVGIRLYLVSEAKAAWTRWVRLRPKLHGQGG